MVAHRRAVGQPGEHVVGGLVSHPRLGAGVLAQRTEHAPGGRRGARDHDRGEDEPVGQSPLASAQGDHRGNAERHGYEHEPPSARFGREPSDRTRDLADRRVQEAAHQRDVGETERHIDEARVDVGDVRVDEHVDRLARQGAQQRDEEQAQRQRAVAPRAEGDARPEGHEEDADGGVAGEQQAGRHHDVALGEGRVDEVHPRDGQRGDAGDDRVERRVEVARPCGSTAAGQPEQRQREEQVAGEGEHVGQERALRREIAERAERDPGGSAGQEEGEGDDLQDPRPGRLGAPAHDAGGGGHQAGHAQHDEGAGGVRTQDTEHVGDEEASARESRTQCPPGSRPLLLNHVGVSHGRPRPTPSASCHTLHASRHIPVPT